MHQPADKNGEQVRARERPSAKELLKWFQPQVEFVQLNYRVFLFEQQTGSGLPPLTAKVTQPVIAMAHSKLFELATEKIH